MRPEEMAERVFRLILGVAVVMLALQIVGGCCAGWGECRKTMPRRWLSGVPPPSRDQEGEVQDGAHSIDGQ